MISSTIFDLPEHRKQVVEACLRQGMFPLRMEDLPADNRESVETSLKMVDEADIYVGVFAYRYGYVPETNNPGQISITEMEYDRAVERNIPRLIFVMSEAHPITFKDVEQGVGADKLKDFKQRLQTENIVKFFKTPDDLRAEAINSLSILRRPDLMKFHHVSDIPARPEVFIAHPYTLLQTHRLIGRRPELSLLNDWVAKSDSDNYQAHVLNIVAIGGMGKSALAWKWFNEIAPQEMKPLAGRMWWSFYESDATFENFVIRALAYVSQSSLDKVQKIPAPERESQLLAALDREPFLLVLDGLERILIAYSGLDAAHLSDDYAAPGTGRAAAPFGFSEDLTQSFTGEHRLRKTADPRVGSFLRKLAGVRAGRILVSTRLYPVDWQNVTGAPLPGCAVVFLSGLSDDDALELWRAFGISGERETLLPFFSCADNHPLLIQLLARRVARARRAPGSFEQWRFNHPDFDPFRLPLVQVKSHILEFALSGLDDQALYALRVIAAFRMPAQYDTLVELLIEKKSERKDKHKLPRVCPLIAEFKPTKCKNEYELDQVLTELEDRGLVGWDTRANRYDLHPIVRGVVWNTLDKDVRGIVYTNLHNYYNPLLYERREKAWWNGAVKAQDPAMVDLYLMLTRTGSLTASTELYNTLVGLECYDEALGVFEAWIYKDFFKSRADSHLKVELLKMLFPDGLDQLPRLKSPAAQGFVFNSLAIEYHFSGEPQRAAALYERANTIHSETNRGDQLLVCMSNLAYALQLSGALYDSEAAARYALSLTRWFVSDDIYDEYRYYEAITLIWRGLTAASCGKPDEAESALRRALRILEVNPYYYFQMEGVANAYLAQKALWTGDFAAARSYAEKAAELAPADMEQDIIRAARLKGEAALKLNDFETAEAQLHEALIRARTVNLVHEELPALVALAELRRRQKDVKAAHEFLDDIWEPAERGPFPIFHADAFNVLAQIERDRGNESAASEAAAGAYRLAWCDGPPFAYHSGLAGARKHLRELKSPEPAMPPFAESGFEPMTEVEIDPQDEFHIGNESRK
jgi:tetratricopeptide (TPR) repeat protein